MEEKKKKRKFTEKDRERNEAYVKEHYFRLNVVLPKELRTEIDAAVKASGLSKNAFIKEAILGKLREQ